MRARRSFLLTLVSALVLSVTALVPSASAGPAWSLVSKLADGTLADVGSNRSGELVAVWRVGYSELWAAFRAPGAGWSTPVRVADRAGSGSIPRVVLDDSGAATAVWTQSGTDGAASVYAASGTVTGWGAPRLLQGPRSGPLGEPFRPGTGPVTAVGPDRTVHVVWAVGTCVERIPPNPRDDYCVRSLTERYYASRTAAGTWSDAEPVDVDMGVSGIAAGPDGVVTLAGPGTAGVVVSTRTESDGWTTPRRVSSPGASMRYAHGVEIVADSADVTVAWPECDDVTRLCHIATSRGPRFDDRQVLSPEVPFGPDGRVNIQHPPVRLAAAPNGEVTAVWNLDEGPDERSEGVIQASRRGVDASGAPGTWQPARALVTGLPGSGSNLVDVAVDDAGAAAVAWNLTEYDAQGGHTRPYLAYRSPDGGWNTPAPLRSHDPTENGTTYVGPLASTGHGGFTALATNVTTDEHYSLGWSDRIDDVSAPSARMTAPGPVATSPRVPVAWTASDGQVAIARTEVQRRAATWRGTYGPWSTWTTSSNDGPTVRTYTGAAARTFCFRVRTTDAAGNTSGWSGERCTATPVDDRAAKVSPGWRRTKVSGSYLGTETTTSRHGRRLTLSGGHGRRYALVATTCPSCGSVQVSLGGKVVKRLSLRTRTTVKRHMLPVATYRSVHTGRLVVTVTSSGRPVRVDGVVVGR